MDALDGRTLPNINPADGSQTTTVAVAAPADMDRAVACARTAFDEGPWPRMSAHDRARVLVRAAGLIERDAQEIAFLETVDMGKPISASSVFDVPFVIRAYEYFGGLGAHLDGATRSTGTENFAYPARGRRRRDHAVQLPADPVHQQAGLGACRQHDCAQACSSRRR